MLFKIAKAQHDIKGDIFMSKHPIPVLAPVALACCAMLAGCSVQQTPLSPGHINEAPRPSGAIPETVQQSAVLAPPVAAPKVETYSVTVHMVPVQSLLFALARDAGMNIDIHPHIEGLVTLNALNQTLPQLLTRISRQVDMRYEIDGKNLTVLPDEPVWRNYKIDYVNIARSTNSSVNIATQISTTGGGGSTAPTPAPSSSPSGTGAAPANSNNGANGNGSNNSTTVVNNRSDNNFWYSLEKNIRDMLRASNLGDNPVDPLAAAAAGAAGGTPQNAQPQTPFDAGAFGGAKA